jgi:integrase
MMWRQAKAWNYVTHDPFEGLVLPKGSRTKRFFFTEEEVKRIINAAAEPERTLYWLAAETGLRADELFGLRAQDVNLEKSAVTVHQAVWNRQVQTPKTDNANREFALSPDLGEHLRAFLTRWRPNPLGLLFTWNPLGRNRNGHKMDGVHRWCHSFRKPSGSRGAGQLQAEATPVTLYVK